MDTKELPREKEERDARHNKLLEMANAMASAKTRERDKYYGKPIKRGRGYTRSNKEQSKRKRLMTQQSKRINRDKRRKTKTMRV